MFDLITNAVCQTALSAVVVALGILFRFRRTDGEIGSIGHFYEIQCVDNLLESLGEIRVWWEFQRLALQNVLDFAFTLVVGLRSRLLLKFVFFVWKVCRIDDGICNFHELTRRNGNMAKTVHARVASLV